MCCWPLLCGETEFVLFHRRQDAQIALDTSRVVIANILLDHLNKLVLAGEPSAVIAFPLQNTPEALHRAVIDAMRHAGHTLCHACLYELVVESAVGVLEPSVAMKQGMRIRIGLNSLIKGLENQRVIVAFTKYIGHNTPVTEIKNGAQIELVNLCSLVPLEFGHIGEPLLIGLCGIKLSVQKILSKILRVLRLSGAAMVVIFHGRADISGPADAEHPFVIDMDSAVMAQIVVEPPVSLMQSAGSACRKPICGKPNAPHGAAHRPTQWDIPFQCALPGSRHRCGAVSLPKGISPLDLVQFF